MVQKLINFTIRNFPIKMDALLWAIRLVIYILPSYFANAVPVVLGGGEPIDSGRKLSDGSPVLGEGKTVRGFFAGIASALLVGALQALLLPGNQWDIYPGSPASYVQAGLLLGAGTMVGDLAGSFIKRRQGIVRGKPSFILDQLMFFAFALAFSYPVAGQLLSLEAVAFLAVLTYFVHAGANVLANRLGLKSVPW